MDKLIYTEEELPQRSQEWLDIRKNVIGGSEIATILGLLQKYSKPVSVWKHKTGKTKKKENPKMTRGAEMEDEAAEIIKQYLTEHEEIHNPAVTKLFAIHPDHRYIGVSFDGVDLDNKFITEIKCPGYVWNFKSVFSDGIQDYYYPQVQLQLMVANAHWGIDKAYFCSYYPDGAYILSPLEFKEYLKKLAVIDIDYDPQYCECLAQVAKKYYKFVEYDYWNEEEYQSIIKEFDECSGKRND
jgi:putative phage-type endonuclease